jgi:hypothetical protein
VDEDENEDENENENENENESLGNSINRGAMPRRWEFCGSIILMLACERDYNGGTLRSLFIFARFKGNRQY